MQFDFLPIRPDQLRLMRPLRRRRQGLHYRNQNFKPVRQFTGLLVAQRFRKQ
jgi:hypothetical protein